VLDLAVSAAPDYRTLSLAIRFESKGIGAGGAPSYDSQNDGHEAIPPSPAGCACS
jgi:hypothetical protein